jgi:hypothetical protein
MRAKSLDNIITTRLSPKFINIKRFQKIIYHHQYQILEILHRHEWREKHIPLSVNLTPTNFKYQFQNKLDKKRTIIIYGEWHHMAYYYHFLTHHHYKVRLVR